MPTALLVAVGLWVATPPRLHFDPDSHGPVVRSESLVPGTEERVIRARASGPSKWVVIALHGFSATRQETAPLAESVATRLNANLLEARLSGHGLRENPMAGVRAEHWLHDAARALRTAAGMGEKFIVIGTSTGATLAAASLDQEFANRIDTLVMISPNFQPRDQNAKWLTRPAGPILAKLIAGNTRCWQPHNELQSRYWTTCYPTSAVVEMMRLVDKANRALPGEISQRLLMFYSPNDKVISPTAALEVFNATAAPQKQAVEVMDADDPSQHVLAGDILSPRKTAAIVDAIVEFIERPAP